MTSLGLELLRLVPSRLASRLWGSIARWERPRWFVRALMSAFVRATGIDLSEAALPLEAHANLEALFVRQLKREARPIAAEEAAVVSPVDGRVGLCGEVAEGMALQVKGSRYSVAALVGDAAIARRFEGGPFATIYLAPHNYHRIHSPVRGKIISARALGGRLRPVFPASLARFPDVFVGNERLVTDLQLADGSLLALVKVGAMLVGRISVVYDPGLRTNRHDRGVQSRSYEGGIVTGRGDELGAFELGSTVVLFAERGALTFDGLREGGVVKVGQRIGSVAASKNP